MLYKEGSRQAVWHCGATRRVSDLLQKICTYKSLARGLSVHLSVFLYTWGSRLLDEAFSTIWRSGGGDDDDDDPPRGSNIGGPVSLSWQPQ